MKYLIILISLIAFSVQANAQTVDCAKCLPNKVTFTNPGCSGGTVVMTRPDNTTYSGTYPLEELPLTGNYTFVCTENGVCIREVILVIEANPAVTADAGSDVSICEGNNTTIGGSPTGDDGSGGFTYSWSPSAGLSSTSIANPVADPTATTTYSVLVTDSKGCQATDQVVVTVTTLSAFNPSCQ